MSSCGSGKISKCHKNPDGAPLTETWAVVYHAQWPYTVSERFVIALYSGPKGSLPVEARFTPNADWVAAYLGTLTLFEMVRREEEFWKQIQSGAVTLTKWEKTKESHYMSCVQIERVSAGIGTPKWTIDVHAERLWERHCESNEAQS